MPRPGQVARLVAAGRLDLDDLGAQVGEDHPAGRAHHHVRELDHAHAGQGQRCRSLRSQCPSGVVTRAAAASARSKVFGRPARHSVPCSRVRRRASRRPWRAARAARQVDAGGHAHAREHEGQVFGRRVAAGAGRVRAAADAGERRVEARDADVAARRRRWPAPGRACRGSGRTRTGRRRSCSACSNSVRTGARIGVAHRVGQADAVGAGVEQRLQQAQHLGRLRPRPGSCSRTPCRRRLRSASSRPTRRARRGCGPLRRRPRRASCAGWRGCARGWPTAAPASGRRRRRVRARRPSGSARAPTRTGRAASWRSASNFGGVGQLRQQPGRHERADLDLALARRRGRRGSIRACARSAGSSRCSAGRRADRPRE